VNLIEGNRKQVIAFLDELSAGPNGLQEARVTLDAWRAHWQEVKERQATWRAQRQARRVEQKSSPEF
jgi:hypothetical protein